MTVAQRIVAWLRGPNVAEGPSKYKGLTLSEKVRSLIGLNTLQRAREIMNEGERDHAAARLPEHKAE